MIVSLGLLANTVKPTSMNVRVIHVQMAVFAWTLWMASNVNVHVVTMMHAASVTWMSVLVIHVKMEERVRMA